MKSPLNFLNIGILLLLFVFLDNLFTSYESLSLVMSVYYCAWVFKNIGKKILIIELLGVGACLTWLCMPIVFYYNFHELTAKWRWEMPVSSDEYFSYVFFATFLFLFGLHIPFYYKKLPQATFYFDAIKNIHLPSLKISNFLLGLSLAALVIKNFVPVTLAQFFEIFENFIFASALYAIFSTSFSKTRNVLISISVILLIAISSGMFGKLVFAAALSFLTVAPLYKNSLTNFKKGLFLTVALMALFFIQSIKGGFRAITWDENFQGNKVQIWFELLTEINDNFEGLFKEDKIFPIAIRMNQGQIVARVMDYIPKSQEYAGADPIIVSIIGGFIPRIIWQDKPKAGGKAAMLLYTGQNINGYSMNVAPIGELYGSLGRSGGIISMFFLGLFFRWSFNKILLIAINTPTLILWLPSIYVLVVAVETDILTIFNAFTKSAFLVWIMYKFFYTFFKIKL
jgi:hypothetical protein